MCSCYNNEESFVCLAVTNGNVLRNPENAKTCWRWVRVRILPNEENHCTAGIGPTSDGRRKPEVYTPGLFDPVISGGNRVRNHRSDRNLDGVSGSCRCDGTDSSVLRRRILPERCAEPCGCHRSQWSLAQGDHRQLRRRHDRYHGYPSNLEGWGSARISDPLFFTGDSRALGVLEDVRNASGFSTGQNTSYNVNVIDSTQDLRITLAFTDVAATAGSAAAAVNNLDLEVIAPNGTTYFGNFFSGGFSAFPAAAATASTTSSRFISTIPQQGSWTVRVVATAVNSGTQGYGVIATGGIQLAPADCNGNGFPTNADISGRYFLRL